jgi:hypothetical protein
MYIVLHIFTMDIEISVCIYILYYIYIKTSFFLMAAIFRSIRTFSSTSLVYSCDFPIHEYLYVYSLCHMSESMS